MMHALGYLLDRSSAALLIFAAAAALSWIAPLSAGKRAAIGLAGIAGAALMPISTRSAFEWLVAAIERPSAPGLLLLGLCAITATTGRRFEHNREFRFGTAVLVLAGLILYPGAVGFLNVDTYAIGYGGYGLPLALAAVLAYALYRRYLFVIAALNASILGFLLDAGRSLNLWDYVIDPVAWLLAVGAWIAIGLTCLIRKIRPRVAAPV